MIQMKIKLDESQEFVKYAVVVGSGALLNMGLLIML